MPADGEGGVHPVGGVHSSRGGSLGQGPRFGCGPPGPPTKGHCPFCTLAPEALGRRLLNLLISFRKRFMRGAGSDDACGCADIVGSSRSPLSYQDVTGFAGFAHPGGGIHCSRGVSRGQGPRFGCGPPEPPTAGQLSLPGAAGGFAITGMAAFPVVASCLPAYIYPSPARPTAATAAVVAMDGSFKSNDVMMQRAWEGDVRVMPVGSTSAAPKAMSHIMLL